MTMTLTVVNADTGQEVELQPAPRRMVAVTVAISEPAGSPEINWPFLLSALVRTHFNSYAIGSLCEGTNCPHGIPCGNPVSPDVLDHDVIRVIDAWRADA